MFFADETYLVLFNHDKKWYRATVKRIIIDDSRDPVGPVSTSDLKCRVEVYYIDFGNTEIVSVEK